MKICSSVSFSPPFFSNLTLSPYLPEIWPNDILLLKLSLALIRVKTPLETNIQTHINLYRNTFFLDSLSTRFLLSCWDFNLLNHPFFKFLLLILFGTTLNHLGDSGYQFCQCVPCTKSLVQLWQLLLLCDEAEGRNMSHFNLCSSAWINNEVPTVCFMKIYRCIWEKVFCVWKCKDSKRNLEE